MTKNHAKRERSDRAVLDNLGALIGGRLKSGMSKLEGLLAEGKEGTRREGGRFMGYVKVFLDDPAVAAVTPSSRYLVERTVKAAAPEKCRVIVEYGPAQGVMTRRLLERLGPDDRLVAVEFNRELYETLAKSVRDPRLTALHGDVREIDAILGDLGVEGADAVVSGVPFAFFSSRGRHELLTKTSKLLRPGGRFVAYQVTTHLIPILKDYFPKVDIQFEVRNIPPHFVFTAHK